MINFDPRPYQQEGIKLLLNNPRFGLFYDMGLGKTAVALSAIAELISTLAINKALIIAPLFVADNVWEDEAKKWNHTRFLKFSKVLGCKKTREAALLKDAHVYLLNRENVTWLCRHYNHNTPFDLICIDELSSFRNPSSQRFKSLAKSTLTTPRLWGLTGTPTPKGFINLWSQMFLLDRGKRLGLTMTDFRHNYCEPDFVGKDGRGNLVIRTYKVPEKHSNAILEKIGDITASLKTSDCIDLPPLILKHVAVRLDEDTQIQYKNFENNKIIDFNASPIASFNAGSLVGKLLQFANGAVYKSDEAQKNTGEYHVIHDNKLNALEGLVEALDGEPVLVAYVFRHDKERILKRLEKYNVRCMKTDQDYKDWNDGKIQVLLTHPASAGHGLNLQYGGCNAVWFGVPNDLELYEQFNKRLHRPGQNNTVVLHHLLVEGTREMDVMEALQKKANVQDYVMQKLKLNYDIL